MPSKKADLEVILIRRHASGDWSRIAPPPGTAIIRVQ